MQARWVWAVGAAFVAGVVAVGVVAAIDDGPQPADAQETTTTTATGGGGTAGRSDSNPLRTVTVTADGTASGTPDTAIVQLGVRTRAESANEALDLANQKATDLLAALDFGGVEKEDITTTNVFVYPQYGNDGRQITGYEAGNTVSVKIRDIENAGTIIDATAGVVGDEIVLEGVSFTIDDTGALREAAGGRVDQREDAGRATGLGQRPVTRGHRVDRRGQRAADPRLPHGGAGGGRRRGSVPLEPGQQELNLAVTVVYELTS